jgi:Ca2+-binding RTX toxin-like protein
VGGLAANDTHSGVDGIIGTDFNDTLIGFDQQGFDPGEEYTNVLYGGDGNDLIQGNGGGDSLYGEAGADTIEGGTGNDVIEGGAGTDSISGGDDADTIDGGTENDTIYGDAGDDSIRGGAGADTLYGGAGVDSIYGDAGADLINLDGGTSGYADGGDDADTLIVADDHTSETLIGGEGGTDQDVLLFINWGGTSGATVTATGDEAGTLTFGTTSATYSQIEEMVLTGYTDVLDLSLDDSGLTLDLGADGDQATLGDGNDTVDGGAGDDTIVGGAGDDSLLAGTGGTHDYLEGGLGADTLIGTGSNWAIIRYGSSASGVDIDLSDGLAESGGEAQGDVLTDIDQIDATSFNDTITTTAGTIVLGFDGDDSLTVASGGATLMGMGGDDTLTGSSGADNLSGGDNDDLILGGAGADTLAGGDDRDLFRLADGFGNDTITGGEGAGSSQDADTIDGSALTGNITVTFAGDENGTLTDGTDTVGFSEIENVFTGGGNDTVNASASTGGVGIFTYAGADSILGSSGADYIEAGDGEDTIVIQDGFGNDTIDGGSGGTDSDTLDLTGLTGPVTVTFTGAESGTVVSGADTISFSDIETVLYSDYADTIDGSGAGASISVTGSDGADTIDGSASADSLDGGDGNDTIVGGVGNDTLIGGLGADSLSGGDDNDQITAGAGADELDGGAGADTLLGGAGADTLLGGLGADSIDGGDDADTIVLADNFGADTIDGGGLGVDSDTLDLTALTSGVTVTFSDAETGTVTSGAQTASFSDIEALSFSDQNDSVDGTSSTQAMSLNAAGGSDTIDGSAQADSLAGGDGGDSISGNDGADTIDGGAGNDTLTGGAGADSVDGGAGNDSITAGEGDTVDGGDGDDTVLVSRDDLSGGTLTVRGGEGAETGGDTLQIIGPATINYTDAESGTATFLDGSVLAFSEFETVQYTACFTDGILMRTARGSVPIEDVRLGDMVLTRDNGFQPVRWAGGRHFSFRDLREHPHLAPIRLKTGSLGAGNPSQDMLLSPQHKVLLTGAQAALWFGEPEVLVAAKDLVKVPGISQVTPRQGVTYRHILFDRHEIVLGDNLWSESFQPGAQTIGALDEAARQELYEIFPELALPEASGHFPAARMVLRASQAQAFVRAFYVPSRKAG